jgi:hypothetical protein
MAEAVLAAGDDDLLIVADPDGGNANGHEHPLGIPAGCRTQF